MCSRGIVLSAVLLAAAGLHLIADQLPSAADADQLVRQLRNLPTPIPGSRGRSPEPTEERRWRVIGELRSLGPPAVRALARALSDPDLSIRRNALLALHFLGSGISNDGRGPKMDIQESVPAVIKSLIDDRDQLVRAWSAQALAVVEPPPAEALPALIRALADPYVGVRLSACAAVARMGPLAAQAGPALVKLLDDTSEDMRQPAVRKAR